MSYSNHLQELIKEESQRQADQLSLIASENYVSQAVRDAAGSMLTNKYAEGYPGKRYYGGCAVVDKIEQEAIAQAQALFQTDYYVNVQPYSGSPANLAVYGALLQPGETVLALSLAQGGHLTHGHNVSLTGQLYHFVHYQVDPTTEKFDYAAIAELAQQHQPKLIVCGATAYPAVIDFPAFAKIAESVGAKLMVDMAHIAGLVAGGTHPTPFGIADVITSTTHKTLRGPRSGIIFCKEELAKAVDKSVFPGLQGGPHLSTVAAMGIAFAEAREPWFKEYAQQIVANAKHLAKSLQGHGFRLVSGGTENHLLLVDLRSSPFLGKEAQIRLEQVGLTANKNMIPFDENPPVNPSGLRLGTAAVTTRGMKEKEMELIAQLITETLSAEASVPQIEEKVKTLARQFPIPTVYGK